MKLTHDIESNDEIIENKERLFYTGYIENWYRKWQWKKLLSYELFNQKEIIYSIYYTLYIHHFESIEVKKTKSRTWTKPFVSWAFDFLLPDERLCAPIQLCKPVHYYHTYDKEFNQNNIR